MDTPKWHGDCLVKVENPINNIVAWIDKDGKCHGDWQEVMRVFSKCEKLQSRLNSAIVLLKNNHIEHDCDSQITSAFCLYCGERLGDVYSKDLDESLHKSDCVYQKFMGEDF